MKWKSITYYVDLENKKFLTKEHIEQQLYLKLKCEIKNNKIDENNGERIITWQCKRNNQLKLF